MKTWEKWWERKTTTMMIMKKSSVYFIYSTRYYYMRVFLCWLTFLFGFLFQFRSFKDISYSKEDYRITGSVTIRLSAVVCKNIWKKNCTHFRFKNVDQNIFSTILLTVTTWIRFSAVFFFFLRKKKYGHFANHGLSLRVKPKIL